MKLLMTVNNTLTFLHNFEVHLNCCLSCLLKIIQSTHLQRIFENQKHNKQLTINSKLEKVRTKFELNLFFHLKNNTLDLLITLRRLTSIEYFKLEDNFLNSNQMIFREKTLLIYSAVQGQILVLYSFITICIDKWRLSCFKNFMD